MVREKSTTVQLLVSLAKEGRKSNRNASMTPEISANLRETKKKRSPFDQTGSDSSLFGSVADVT
jgi:hypothetical protein